MKKSLLFLAAASLFAFASCDPTAKVDDKPVEVKVQLTLGGSAYEAADVTVSLAETSGTTTFEEKTNASGVATFTVPSGLYTATAAFKVASEGVMSTLTGSTNVSVAPGSSVETNLPLNKVEASQVIIKELYCTACVKDDGKTTYTNDAYVTLYNNSELEADVTDVVFGVLQPANAHATNKYMVDGALTYTNHVPAYSGIWYFQNPTKIAPYSSLTVAIFGAINHTTTVSNSVDLSKPEYYVMSKTGVSQITNSKYQVAETIPTDHYLSAKMFNLGNAWVLSNTSPAFFIGQMKLADLTALIDNTADYDLQGGSDNIGWAPKFPVNHIVDAIDCWDSANIDRSNHRFPASVNTGHAVMHSKLGHSFYRNVDKAATEALPENAGKLVYDYAGGTADMEGTTDPSGIDAEASIAAGCHIVYSDTNNSGTDFHERKTAALKK